MGKVVVTCPNCGRRLHKIVSEIYDRQAEIICPYCSIRFVVRICPKCGAAAKRDARYCPECGTEMPSSHQEIEDEN